MSSPGSTALNHITICDFSGQLAGAGATRFLGAFGAKVIRIEDPVLQGRWDILRGNPPYPPGKTAGINMGGAFNNHNIEKLGITLNLRKPRARELLAEIVQQSDVVVENFAAGVMKRLGFHYDELKAIKDDIIYVSASGFGHTGPYVNFKTWGPIVQAISGLTFGSGLPDMPAAGWGYSFMDHTDGYYVAMAIMLAIRYRNRTGKGQWVDMSCTEAGAVLNGPALLDYTVNGRPLRRPGMPNSNRNQHPAMAPHGIYPSQGEDRWVAVAVRNDADWAAFGRALGEPEWTQDPRYATVDGRVTRQDELDALVGAWTCGLTPMEAAQTLQASGVPAAPVQRPQERVDQDPNTEQWGLWPTVTQTEMGQVRVDGAGVHLSETDWSITRGAPCLGEHNREVYGEMLGLSDAEIDQLTAEGVI
ncbi:MAG: CoA transferase [Chloroflexi bacterium]|nr:CoA transferase [Chloroflexota bacterium]